MKVFVLELKQDDPHKCTAAKLVKFDLIQSTRSVPNNTIVLNPLSKIIISKTDLDLAKSICAIDCSWNYFSETFKKFTILHKRINRRLPLLLAGNPVNYSKIGKLTTAEAIAGCLYILGFKSYAEELMNKFKWGHTFIDLNLELLELYKEQENSDQIL
ncbi:MAG TPA: DUF367 family protein, partial [Nitrososphaeraceae archaeon]|nr:DUF367 family protein [Nitrososphaeraceae archaeon]